MSESSRPALPWLSSPAPLPPGIAACEMERPLWSPWPCQPRQPGIQQTLIVSPRRSPCTWGHPAVSSAIRPPSTVPTGNGGRASGRHHGGGERPWPWAEGGQGLGSRLRSPSLTGLIPVLVPALEAQVWVCRSLCAAPASPSVCCPPHPLCAAPASPPVRGPERGAGS